MLIKNPWGKMSYKGKFSSQDSKNWTNELKRALRFDAVAQKDQGVFWVDFETFCSIYETVYLNWDPSQLSFKKSFFESWRAEDMNQQKFIQVKNNP